LHRIVRKYCKKKQGGVPDAAEPWAHPPNILFFRPLRKSKKKDTQKDSTQ